MTLPTAPHAQMEIPPDSYERVRLIGTINGLTGEFTPNPATIPATDGRPFAPEQDYHVTVETPPENPTEKKSRSYTKRVEIGGKCVLVTLHHDRIELREKWGRQRAVWSLEKLWDAAEGKLL